MSPIPKTSQDQFLGLDFSYSKATLVCDMFSFVFWENPRPGKNVSRLSDLYLDGLNIHLSAVWLSSCQDDLEMLFWVASLDSQSANYYLKFSFSEKATKICAIFLMV